VDPGFMCERLLAPAFLLSEPPQILGQALSYIHDRSKTRLSSIDLQTISDIPFDLPRRRSIRAPVTDSMRSGQYDRWLQAAARGMTLVLMEEGRGPQMVSRVPQGEARREHTLRDLIYDNPAIMPVHDLDPSYGRLFTVARELTVPGVGFIDVVLADERGRLVIIECKLWRNPQARREVVGQILDYARELSRYSYDDLQRQISVATKRRGNVLYELAREADSNLDEAAFVDRVARDLMAGRFLLLVVGDGITEGTRRIGEYLRGQPGLAFEFGLIEMAEYRYADADGRDRLIVQPRVIAATTVIERHVIRSEVPGLVIDALDEPAPHSRPSSPGSGTDASQTWTRFVEAFVRDTRFDDPGQPAPRRGGIGWMRIQLPSNLYINAYRSSGTNNIGVSVRFAGAEGADIWAALNTDREAIDREFVDGGLPAPEWSEQDGVGNLSLTQSSPAPWDAAIEGSQRQWLGRAANQFVNSLRPRLQRLYGGVN
jgi:hypothetical protein